VLSGADVETDRSIRFALWNNEETGFNGSVAYVQQRAALQGKENPPGSGRHPEPKWLGMIQRDMMLWDHGLPRADGTVDPEQRVEADLNIDFQSTSRREREFRREKAWRGQRPRRHFWRHRPIPGDRDRAIPRLWRQSHGKSKTIPTALGKQNCAGLRGGAGRTRTSNQTIMDGG
jgi:hypothetical protein